MKTGRMLAGHLSIGRVQGGREDVGPIRVELTDHLAREAPEDGTWQSVRFIRWVDPETGEPFDPRGQGGQG